VCGGRPRGTSGQKMHQKAGETRACPRKCMGVKGMAGKGCRSNTPDLRLAQYHQLERKIYENRIVRSAQCKG
jgi:hypothetical protein